MNGELSAALNKADLPLDKSPIQAPRLAALVARIADGTLSSKLAKQVFEAMWQSDLMPDAIIERDGLKQMDDVAAILELVKVAIAANPKAADEFKAGNEKALNALAGQVMKASKGKANPAQVQSLLREQLI
jgi:aspartyl-tRNA(Asn)/glutamyl-tRNA(Gln) amidotransferase subunit B